MKKRLFYLFFICVFCGICSYKVFLSEATKSSEIVQELKFEKDNCNGKIIGYISGPYQHIYKQRKPVNCNINVM